MDRTGDAASPARQEAACRDIVAAKGWTVAEVFVDRDLSAYKRVPRPAYDELLCALRDRRIDAVTVFKLDRLTRRFTDTGHW
jgi:DNA invertase Pin-like site-specific DNA recombinase